MAPALRSNSEPAPLLMAPRAPLYAGRDPDVAAFALFVTPKFSVHRHDAFSGHDGMWATRLPPCISSLGCSALDTSRLGSSLKLPLSWVGTWDAVNSYRVSPIADSSSPPSDKMGGDSRGFNSLAVLRVHSLKLSSNGKTSKVHYRTLSFFAFRFKKNENSLFFVFSSTKSLSNLFASLRYCIVLK